MNQLSDLRLRLAEARITLRRAKDAESVTRAIAEQNAIERLNGNAGKNEAERARNLIIALFDDDTYSAALVLLRGCEAEVDRLNAEIAVEEDAVRLNEARIREKLADALLGKTQDNQATDYSYTWGNTEEDVHWQQHMGTQERHHPDDWRIDTDPVFPAGSNAGGEYPR